VSPNRQARLRAALRPVVAAVGLALLAPGALQPAWAGPGKVCLDGVTPLTAASPTCAAGVVGTYYANSPPLRKFVDTLAGLTSAGANTFASGAPGEYISVAEPDTTTYPGSEYFVIGVVEHDQRMHSDLKKATTSRSYVQLYPPLAERGVGASNPPTPAAASAYAGFGAQKPGTPVALSYPDGSPIHWPGTSEPVYAYDKAHYLGPVILTATGTAVRIKFVNFLPTGRATTDAAGNVTARNGDMFLPTDESLAGAGSAPAGGKYPQNRVAFHLHGGDSPWISDGTPHQWLAAAGDPTPYKHGDRFVNTPDMPYPGDGGQTTFWPNDQSARLMWYHDHTFGLTRQNAYSGAAAGYVIYDAAELALINGGTVNSVSITKAIPNTLLEQIVLVVQDKGFVPDDIAVQDAKWDQNAWGKPGDLWYPHVYEPFQIWDKGPLGSTTAGQLFPLTRAPAFVNPAGRWDYAVDDATGGYRVPNVPLRADPDYGNVAFPDGTYTGGPSATPESYMDTPVVNGIAYPVLNVEPKAYRVRFLNGANDRYWNLSLWQADSTQISSDGRTNTEVKIIPELTPVAGVAMVAGGSGYSPSTTVTISDLKGTGTGARAKATVTAGVITAINVTAPGTGYLNPQVTITDPTGKGATAIAFAGRPGGIPDPATAGPNIIRFANEGGLLAAPVVHKPKPMSGFTDPLTGAFTLQRDSGSNFYLGGAERADTVIDFSHYAGKTLILYNDSSAPVPGGDDRYDYYTGDPDQTTGGGAPTTLAGFGPNTRTVMQINVAATAPAPPYDPNGNGGPLATELPKAYAASADAHILASGTLPTAVSAATSSMSLNGVSVPLKVKTIQGFTDPNFGRLIAQIGTELQHDPVTGALNITNAATPLSYVDTPTDIISEGETQYWWIKNNDVDNHPMHFHLFNVQVVARLDHASGAILPPQPDETGWKETVKNWPLEDVIVAIKPKTPALPFGLPKSLRNLDPTLIAGAANSSFDRPGADLISAFFQYDVVTGLPFLDTKNNVVPVVNGLQDFDWEYVWHCHILGHEENDLMRPLVFHPAPPTRPATGPGSVSVDATGKVAWTDPTPAALATTKGNTANEIGFRVERALVTTSTGVRKVGTYTALAPNAPVVDPRVNTLANATAFQDAPAPFTDYAYRVVSVNEGGTVASSSVTLTQPPAPPAALTAAVALVAPPAGAAPIAGGSGPKVLLSWQDVATNETGYVVQRASASISAASGAITWAAYAGRPTPTSTLAPNLASYTDGPSGLGMNALYRYRVYAVDGALAGAASEVPVATATALLPPLQLQAGGLPTSSTIPLQFQSTTSALATGYEAQHCAGTAAVCSAAPATSWQPTPGTAIAGASNNHVVATGLAAKTTYSLRIRAVNSALPALVSPWSALYVTRTK
jgi:FtsP/CotA-like multicopper oxidase with cupredoxin domain